MPTQGASITVQGGLDLVSSSHALFRTPGAATKLQNFESSTTRSALLGINRLQSTKQVGGPTANKRHRDLLQNPLESHRF